MLKSGAEILYVVISLDKLHQSWGLNILSRALTQPAAGRKKIVFFLERVAFSRCKGP